MKRPDGKLDKKRILAAAIAVIIVFVMIIGAAAPLVFGQEMLPNMDAKRDRENSDISIEGEMGFSGRYKLSGMTPFVITLQNAGADFKGKLQVKIDVADGTSKSKYQIYAMPVELPRGGSKRVELEIPINTLKAFQTVVLVDGKGKEVANKKLFARGQNPESIFVSVLSDNPEALNYLKQLGLNINMDPSAHSVGQNLFMMDEKSFPGSAAILNSFNVVVADDFDMGKLSDEQNAALAEWLATGGTLLLGTGGSYDKVMKGTVSDVAPIEKTGTDTVSNFAPEDPAITAMTAGGAEAEFLKLSAAGAEAVTNAEGQALAYKAAVGKGVVFALPFALSAEPFLSMENKDLFLTGLVVSDVSTRMYVKLNMNRQDYSYFSSNLPAQSDKLLIIIVIIVFVYAAVLIPVVYVILKKKDIREKGFVILPALAIVVTGIIAVISADTTYRKAIINSVSTMRLENGQTDTSVRVDTTVFTPNKGDIVVSFDKNVPVQFSSQYNYYYYGYYEPPQRSAQENLVEVLSGDTPQLTFFGNASWNGNSFYLTESVSLPGALTCDLRLEGQKVTGTLRNETGFDLDEVLVGMRNSFIKLEDVKNGETADIAIDVDMAGYTDIYMAMNQLYGDVYDPALHLTQEEKRVINLKRNLISNLYEARFAQSYSSGYGGYARTVAVSSRAVPAAPTGMGGEGVAATVFAFTKSKVADVGMSVQNTPANSYNMSLLNMNVPVNVFDGGKFDLPFGFLTVSDIQTSALFDQYNENEIYMRSPADVEFKFALPAGAKLDELEITWESYGTSFTKEILNCKTGEAEALSTSAYTGNANDYINQSGEITLKAAGAMDAVQMPKIRLKGEQ